MKDERINYILQTLNPPAGKGLWHGGPTVIGSIRGVSAEEAKWMPDKKRHSIWDLALHIAYWKYAVRNKLTGGESGQFPRSPANWPAVPEEAGEKVWKADRSLVKEEHELLIEAVENFVPDKLDKKVEGSDKWTYADLLMGVVTHDVYHTGQIIFIKRMIKH